MIARRIERASRTARSALSMRRIVTSPLVLVVLGSALLGIGSGLLVARATDGDEIVVGNTGGTLSGIVRVGGSTIVVGGGNARSALADLVGRSTAPWKRRIDLLIVPGWDNQQVIGALGLIERGHVGSIVIVGQPTGDAAWTVLQQVAARDDIPVSVVDGHDIVTLSHDIQVDLFAEQPGTGQAAQYAVVSLRYYQSSVTFIDASKDGSAAMNVNGIGIERVHLLAAMRPLTSVPARADVLLQPPAATSSDLAGIGPKFAGEIRSGQRVTVRLRQADLRLPLSAVTAVSTNHP